MSKLKVYKASAGAGKTFALTMEFFKIVFADPLEYKHVLAVTFTNKATEEMKSRIVRELNKLAGGRESDYGEELKRFLHLTDEQVKERAKVLRTLILHDYGRLSVTTIDRFFQRVIKSFTKELGIFPGYNVELDSDYVLLQAVDQVVQRMSTDLELCSWITELMNTSVEETKSWSIKGKIAELGKELFGESYMLFDKNIQEKFNDRKFLKNYRTFLQGIVRNFEDHLMEYGHKACCLIAENSLQISDFKNGSRGVANQFVKFKDKLFDKVTDSARGAVDNPEGWMTKKLDSATRTRIESIYPALNGYLKESIGFYDTNLGDYISARLLLGNLYQLGILNDLYREIRNYCEEKGLMLLSDTTRILSVLIAGNDTSFLFEKTGNFYHHIMIDEFQDTSAMQWTNFRPLIVNTLSEGGKALLVGDVKQSIYRWRNGDWRLLAEGVQRNFATFGIEDEILESNWRSNRDIVEFNNLFFERASLHLRKLYESECPEAIAYASLITTAYGELKQTVRKNTQGYVEISFGGEKQEEESDEEIMENVIRVIADVIHRGGALKDCVILVRDGKEGAFVADYLIEHNKKRDTFFPIPFISNDSLYVVSSPYVELIVNVLKYLTEPYDRVNRAVLLYNYYTFVADRSPVDHDVLFKTVDSDATFLETLNIPFLQDRDRLFSGTLFEIVETIIENFGMKKREEELPYLVAFQDIVFDYELNNTNSIPVFLEWWEKEKTKKVLSTSEEADAVRILTIHKSKGLEFKTVILPFCAWDLDDTRHGRRIWCCNGEKGFSTLEYAPLNYSSKLINSHFMADYLEEHMKSYVDNLNLLYVALTRAERELYIFPYAPKINKEGRPSDIGAFLFQTLEELAKEGKLPFWNPDLKRVELGERSLIKEKGEEQSGKTINLTEYPIYDLSGRVSVSFQYENYTDSETSVLSAVDEGKLLHDIFSRIETRNDVSRAVDYLYRSGVINREERDSYEKRVIAYLKQDIPSAWFDGTYKVMNEREMLFENGDKARPDRVLIKGKQAMVVDYKFGSKEETDYRKQVGFYCKTLRQMGYHDVKGYIWYVHLNKVVSVGKESTVGKYRTDD